LFKANRVLMTLYDEKEFQSIGSCEEEAIL